MPLFKNERMATSRIPKVIIKDNLSSTISEKIIALQFYLNKLILKLYDFY